ncbi:MAG TPA: hypothetical protein VGV12_16440 [Gemmatimonadales bacterium]|nr:hypothetical protein [Gemmatimonadales bacterium]
MRTAFCAAVVVAACAPGDRSRDSTPAGPAQKYAGTWEGRSFRSESDTGTPIRIVAHVAQDGTLRSTLLFTTGQAPPIPIRARQVTETLLVNDIGPYHSPTANADVVTTTTGKLFGDSLNGTFLMRPAAGGNAIMNGTFRTKRVTQ